MAETNSTPSTVSGKPAKPYANFPLFAHAAGVWAKKIRGKLHYFGPWGDPDGALAKYNEQKDALHAGRKPREETGGVTVKELANKFLSAKQTLVDNGELSPRTWAQYKGVCEEVVKAFGKVRLVIDLDPDDFAKLRNNAAKRFGPHVLNTFVQIVRCLFKYGFDAGMIDRPIRFGPGFKRPSKKTMRLHRAKQGVKMFTAEEIRKLIDAANQPLKAMLLLGINCGYNNSDCGKLTLAVVNLDAGMIDYPRPKTGIRRRCPLWPETVDAVREALARRPKPKDPVNNDLVFITKYGDRWDKDTSDNPITKEVAKLLHKLHTNGRKGLGFATLRHTFRTVADEAKDQPAADFIMGHESSHMSSVYRESISNARLKAVTDHVREWLFAGK